MISRLLVLSLVCCLLPSSTQSAKEEKNEGKDGGGKTVIIRGPDDADWWKHTIVYQIYPRSFQDSNGDGVGDIQGIISRLDHIKYLGVGAIWLSPVYKSPMVDHGYDIQDFVDIDPVFGTLADFDQLVREAHARGIHVIMDYIPNHTSNLHPWFVESRKGGADNRYSDYYVWSDGKLLENGTRVPPNNWMSCFSVPAWTWDEVRQQFYLHQFAKEQPDLNYRKTSVRIAMIQVLEFWLDRGVDGFRVDAIGTLFEVEDLSLDSPRSFLPNVEPHEQFYYDHIYTRDRPEIHDIVRKWRILFDNHDKKHGGHTFMVTEIYSSLEEEIKYYDSGADMPFNFGFIVDHLDRCGGECFKKIIQEWLDVVPLQKWPNYVLGNHDKPRISTRKGRQYVNALNVLLLTLPGTPTTYYGEELGMEDIDVSYEDTQDPWGRNLGPELYRSATRDPCRSPMQWSAEKNAGFSTADKTWLPVHPDYRTRNVNTQKTQRGSSLEIYRAVSKLRQRPEFRSRFLTYIVANENVLSYLRFEPYVRGVTTDVYLVAVNVGREASTDNHTVKVAYQGLDRTFQVGVVVVDTESPSAEGSVVGLESIRLKVGQAIVLKLNDNSHGTKDEL